MSLRTNLIYCLLFIFHLTAFSNQGDPEMTTELQERIENLSAEKKKLLKKN